MICRRDALAALAAVTVAGFAPALRAEDAATVHDDEMILGDPGAPVTIIEYSSLTCPHCAKFHNETLAQIKEAYIDTGKVRLVYRDFPFDRPGQLAAAMARCAGPDRFFGFIEVLFRSQASWARVQDSVGTLKRIGRLGGLSAGEIERCFADQDGLKRVLNSRLRGAKVFDIKSTPSFIIEGEMLVGAKPFEDFRDVIERMLSKS